MLRRFMARWIIKHLADPLDALELEIKLKTGDHADAHGGLLDSVDDGLIELVRDGVVKAHVIRPINKIILTRVV